jgi:hypothetical protein
MGRKKTTKRLVAEYAGDELDDLYPGSGVVRLVWDRVIGREQDVGT